MVLGESRTINLDSGPPSPVSASPSAGPSTAKSKAALLAEWRTARHRPRSQKPCFSRRALPPPRDQRQICPLCGRACTPEQPVPL
jgi:hypothetical protein